MQQDTCVARAEIDGPLKYGNEAGRLKFSLTANTPLDIPLGATAPKLCSFSPLLNGSSTASFNFTFTSSSPPISSHRVLGISKATSRRALGFTLSLAASRSEVDTRGSTRLEYSRESPACS